MEVTRPKKRVLLTGASGYVGGRLLPRLEERGLLVRCLARRPEFLAGRVGPKTEVVEGDVLREETLPPALECVHTAYYMVHSMGSTSQAGFEEQDRLGACNFASVALAAGVRRIVYLGDLGDEDADLSPHLRSRHEVGRALRAAGVPVIEFRASVVIGSGSFSFEMLRALVERLPVMVTPRWVDVTAQPIAIGDLLAYLEAALDLETEESRIYEIGGAERVSYGDLMRQYARRRQLRRFIDLLAGGVGLRRGRPDPGRLQIGDTVDWWRVEEYEPDHLLRLRAEMRLPGRAWLEFEVRPTDCGSAVRQTAVFDPSGLLGLSYWYGIYPLHAVVFRGMLDGIARAAQRKGGGRKAARV